MTSSWSHFLQLCVWYLRVTLYVTHLCHCYHFVFVFQTSKSAGAMVLKFEDETSTSIVPCGIDEKI